MKKPIATCFFIFLLMTLSDWLYGASINPLPVRTQNPLYLQFLAMPLENAHTLERNSMVATVSTTFSNVFEYRPTGVTQINFDMELWRTAFTLNYGLASHVDLKLELPFITSAGGFLDPVIQSYHDFLGLPNGGRNLVSNHTHTFTLKQNGITLFNYAQSSFGLADITVRAKHQLPLVSKRFTLAVAPYVKFPTGLATHGLSSGHTDIGASLFLQTDISRLHFSTQVGGAYLTGSDTVSALLTNGYFAFAQSVAFEVSPGFIPTVQVNGNTSIFHDVSAKELTGIAFDLNVGATGNFYKGELFYQVTFGEDITAIGPSVDFSLLALIGVRY